MYMSVVHTEILKINQKSALVIIIHSLINHPLIGPVQLQSEPTMGVHTTECKGVGSTRVQMCGRHVNRIGDVKIALGRRRGTFVVSPK